MVAHGRHGVGEDGIGRVEQACGRHEMVGQRMAQQLDDQHVAQAVEHQFLSQPAMLRLVEQQLEHASHRRQLRQRHLQAGRQAVDRSLAVARQMHAGA